MYDVFMILGWLAHMLALGGLSLFAAHRLKLPRKDWPFVLFVLLWTTLVLSGHMASVGGNLNALGPYVLFSFIALAALWSGLRYADGKAAPLVPAPRLEFTSLNHAKMRRFLWWTFGGTLALAVILNAVIVFSVHPDNADSIIYRLPRAFWYVSNGSFLHPFDALDKRLTFYPLNGVALYVPFVLYGLPPMAHSLPSLFMWLTVGYATYRFARSLGADKLISFIAMWLVAMTPNILAQAVSTNDEILCATALVVGLYLSWSWLTTGRRVYFLLATTSIGLSIGTKLHIVFLALPLLIGTFWIAREILREPKLIKKWLTNIGSHTGTASVVMLLLMVVPFMIYNYLSCGRFYFTDDFAHDVFNLAGNLQAMLQNLLIYTAQMTLAPVGDLNFWPYADARQAFNTALNEITTPLIAPFINQDPSFYHFDYRFKGVTISTSIRFVEFSLWAGFVWLLWPLQIALAARCRQVFPFKRMFLLIAMTPLLWLLSWSATTLYMEGTATYFSYYLIVAAPAAVLVFLPMRRSFLSELRWVVITFVALTSFIIVGNIYAYSGFRSITDIVRASRWPFDWQLFDGRVVEEIKRADKIRILFTHEKMPYFGYMRWNPKAVYYNPYEPPPLDIRPQVLQIIPVSSLYMLRFMPIRVPGKLVPGATYLGLIRGIGREAIFAMGNDVEKRYPKESDYILPQLTVVKTDNGYQVGFMGTDPIGYHPDDSLEFRYTIRTDNQVFYRRDWERSIKFETTLPHDPTVYRYVMEIQVRSAWSHKELSTQTYQIVGPGQWLPEGPEY